MAYDTDALAKLGREHRKITTALSRIRKALAEEIPKAGAEGVTQTKIVELTGYTRETVRQLCLTPEQKEDARRKRRKHAKGTSGETLETSGLENGS